MRQPREAAPPHTPSPSSGEGKVLLAVVTAPHGVRGLVRLKSFAAEPESLTRYPLVSEDGARVQLSLVGSGKGVLLARIAGVGDRNAAEPWKGARLYAHRSDLPPPEDDEFYHADLLGLAAQLRDGTVIGRVRAINDFGAGDMLEIERPDKAPLVLPFTRAVVPTVDIAGGRILVAPPEGLL
ncbi:MAG: ribosome maturation factor RimM [Stellaceae bacterium]